MCNTVDASVDKATDEAQTSESWDLLLTICDKVDLEGESGFALAFDVAWG
jgi:hypothetical protein